MALGRSLDGRRALEHRLLVRADKDLVRHSLPTRSPTQGTIHRHTRRPGGRLRLSGLNGNMEKPHFAEPILTHGTVTAVYDHPHVPGRHATHVDAGVGLVVGPGRRPVELRVTQR